MAKYYNTKQSRFFCTQCGKEGIPVHRKKGQEREGGHLKKLYCIYCGKEVNHVEIRDVGEYNLEDFKQEYNLGRFVNGNRIAIKDLLDCTCKNCSFNINGKCWNSNWSNNCRHRIKEVDNNE